MVDPINRQEVIDLLSDYKDQLLGALDCMAIVGVERRIIESLLELIEGCIEDIESLPCAQQPKSELQIAKITDLVEGTIDHLDKDDAIDLLYQIKGVLNK